MTPKRQTKSQTLLRIGIDVKATLTRIPRETARAASFSSRTKIAEMKAGWAINSVSLNVYLSRAKTALRALLG
jgi:hypothetical protein